MRVSGPNPIASVPPPFPAPVLASNDPRTAPNPPLDPAVRLDIRTDDATQAATSRREDVPAAKAEETPRVFIDATTKSVVYQAVDPASGDVVFQLPDPVVLKVRGYEAAQARTAEAASKTLDRSA